MPRKRRVGKVHREPLQPSMAEFFRSGSHEAAQRARDAAEPGAGGFRGLIQLLLRGREHPALWSDHGADIVEAFWREHPGRRPWGWWRHSAPGPRLVLAAGGARIARLGEWEHVWRESFGIPRIEPADASITVESQAAYLKRLGLLTAAERRALPADAFEPEVVLPAAEDDEDKTDEEDLKNGGYGA
jgi:hypothetical protein